MDIIYLLVPMAVILAVLIAAGFFWSVRSGQFDDLEGPAHRIIMDDDTPPGWKEQDTQKEGDDQQ